MTTTLDFVDFTAFESPSEREERLSVLAGTPLLSDREVVEAADQVAEDLDEAYRFAETFGYAPIDIHDALRFMDVA